MPKPAFIETAVCLQGEGCGSYGSVYKVRGVVVMAVSTG